MKIILASPRCFCAGVERAILCVEQVLERHGAPIYVLKDIVHNAHVVNELKSRGVVFVRDLEQVPPGAHLLFSAHGVGPEQWQMAWKRGLKVIDATCPLVEKVHREAREFADAGYTVILIGEARHDEVLGTQAWAPDRIRVVFSEAEVEAVSVDDPAKVAYLTQTTLSLEDCEALITALKKRFPKIVGPPSSDICYATRNRQRAVKELAAEADIALIVGDPKSANSKRLQSISAQKVRDAYLITSAETIEDAWFEGVETVLVSSGASTPEYLVQRIIERIKQIAPCEVVERVVVHENIHFEPPENI